jgi:hypothetical protein
MDRPTRQQQAEAILTLRAQRLASRILGRRATGAADFAEAFNLEWVDLISEIPTPEAMMALGRNIVGPKDGLYILRDDNSYRVFLQEKGRDYNVVAGVGFEEARDAVIHRLIQLQGLPFTPPGA